MFEASAQEEKQDSKTKMWISIFVVVALAGLGALYHYIGGSTSNGTATTPAQSTAPAAAEAPAAPADLVRDLKVQRVSMQKDRSGTTAVWSVTIENRSNAYTYNKIQYETTYLGAGNKTLLVNKGVIADSVGAGAQVTPEIRDAAYPPGTVLYKFKIIDAKASQ